jgi:hypothetical protein
VAVLSSVGCAHGILEISEYDDEAMPRITLVPFESNSELLRLKDLPRRAWLQIFDTERLSSRFLTVPSAPGDMNSAEESPREEVSQCLDPESHESEELFLFPGAKARSSPIAGPNLHSSASPSKGGIHDGGKVQRQRPRIERDPTNGTGDIHTDTLLEDEPSEYVHTMERLFRDFKKQAVDVLGLRLEPLVHAAVHNAHLVNPDFDSEGLQDQTAIAVLQVMEGVMKESPLLKRSKLKALILTLVADLYQKHYESLDRQAGAIDEVESLYARLKG